MQALLVICCEILGPKRGRRSQHSLINSVGTEIIKTTLKKSVRKPGAYLSRADNPSKRICLMHIEKAKPQIHD